MRIAVISDIHIDVNKDYDVLGTIAEYVKKKAVKLLLIAGDITSYPKQSIEAVKELEKISGIKVLYVPGNHDLWNKDEEFADNDEIYKQFCEDEHCLSGKSYVIGDYAIIGDVGWYDYSFGSRQFSKADFDKQSINGRTWQDSIFNTWSKDNENRCDWFISKLEEEILKHSGKRIILMTHMLSHKAFTVPEDWQDWSYFNGFLGSEKLHELCRRYKVEYAICGHVHFRKTFTEENTTYMCRCLNYYKEWLDGKDLKAQVENAFDIIEL